MNNFLSITSLEKFLESHPNSLIFAILASRYLEQGNIQKAVGLLEPGLKNYPDFAFGHFVMGMCYYQLKDYPKAKAHLEISTGYDEKNPRAWKILGEINEQLDLPMQAEECYQKFFLLDQFNEEAVRKLQKEEILEFEAFSEEQAETAEAEEKKETEAAEEGGFEQLLEEATEESELEKGISKEVDEVFKETLGTLPDEENWGVEPTETIPGETPTEEAPQPAGEEATAETTDEKFAEDFIDFMEETGEGVEEEKSEPAGTVVEGEEAEESESPLPEEAGKVEDAGQTKAETEAEEELMDFSSVVEDIISEREVELKEELPGEEDKTGTTMTIIRDEESSEAEEEITTHPSPSPAEEATEKTAQFGKPPILSPTLGEIYIAQGRFQEALEVFKQLLEKDPDNQRFQRKIKDIELLIQKKESGENDS